jgi:hypothetical protein
MSHAILNVVTSMSHTTPFAVTHFGSKSAKSIFYHLLFF